MKKITTPDAAPPMCEWCGKHPVRKTVSARGVRKPWKSKYCSEECAKKSRSAALVKANAARACRTPGEDEFFPVVGARHDWRDMQVHPFL